MTNRPPSEEELDEAARRLIPKLEEIADLAMAEPHAFDSEPNIEHRRKLQLRGARATDPVGITDSIEVKITSAFGPPKWCALNRHNRASEEPLELILELYPGASGRLELYLCPRHRAELINDYRRRAMQGNTPVLHFAGRRIIAIGPKPLDVDEVLEASSEFL